MSAEIFDYFQISRSSISEKSTEKKRPKPVYSPPHRSIKPYPPRLAEGGGEGVPPIELAGEGYLFVADLDAGDTSILPPPPQEPAGEGVLRIPIPSLSFFPAICFS